MRRVLALTILLASAAAGVRGGDGAKQPSFFRDVRPILQAKCAGCHQPAKAGDQIVLTGFGELMRGDKRGDPLIVAGKPDESPLVEVLLPRDGKPPKMPKKGEPLAGAEVATIRAWIEAGAQDDTPAAARETFATDHPPVYRQPPIVTSLDFSPDGKLLAVSGYHEVLLYDTAGDGALLGRLVGLSERIQTVAFSPDGTLLLVVGGSPARLGEVQLWRVSERTLERSVPVGFDTLYGGSWSKDGKRVAFGDGHVVRALDVSTGALVLYQGAHEDLVLDTAFSLDGSEIVSVSRDRSMKLIEVATQQFVDNITSITPGALKGGLIAVAREPRSDTLLVGGADGTPKTYQMHRTKDRKIGDDYNLIKAYAPLDGRIFAVAWSPDGKSFATGASLIAEGAAGHGEVRRYQTDQTDPAWKLPTDAAIYTVALDPQGHLIAAGGFDGQILLIDPATGHLVRRFPAVPITN